MSELFEGVVSLGGGAVFGAGLGGLIFAVIPQAFPGALGLESTMWLGGLVGGGLHHYLGRVLLGPFLDRRDFLNRLEELEALHRAGRISEAVYHELRDELVRERILGRPVLTKLLNR